MGPAGNHSASVGIQVIPLILDFRPTGCCGIVCVYVVKEPVDFDPTRFRRRDIERGLRAKSGWGGATDRVGGARTRFYGGGSR